MLLIIKNADRTVVEPLWNISDEIGVGNTGLYVVIQVTGTS